MLGILAAAFFQSLEIFAAENAAGIRGLIERVVPGREAAFICETIPADAGRDVFEIESLGGKIVLRGNSPLSQAVALNWYLKYCAHCDVSLNGRQVNLPEKLPAVERKIRQNAWAQSRYFLNYCTFGYSMPWWDWKQWEFFIDWMALNGINQPLAVTGQEAVWQAVCKRFGMSDAEIEAFFAGPPYLPFQWMGCLDSHGGPLPKDWVARHAELQKKILARERELGITPVLQGFTGHVPEALLKKFPGAKSHKIHWIEFDTFMLDPLDPLFQKLGAAFIEEQTKLFGTDHLYAADSFIEMTPPSGDLAYLANTGRAIYDGMAKADPRAVWVLQGWIFINQAKFWQQDRIKAFFDAVPSERMLVLDLNCEERPTWSKTQGFFGKPWVWCFLYNYGNRTILGSLGTLERFNDAMSVRQDALGKNVRGVGLMMEGFGHNPPYLDLMFEMAWRNHVDDKLWLQDFVRYRYGKENVSALAAWEILRTRIYNRGTDNGHSGYTIVSASPAIARHFSRYPAAALTSSYRKLLDASDDLGSAATYRHDLVNVARQALSNRAGDLYARAMSAFATKDIDAFRKSSGEFLDLLRDLDSLLATSDEFLLGSWLEDAKRWGGNDGERARLEWNARRIITLWGINSIRDYAWKEWSGLVNDFYARRWALFFQHQQAALDSGKPFEPASCAKAIRAFEETWCNERITFPTKPSGDSIAEARRIFTKYFTTTHAVGNLALGKPVTCSFALPGMEAGLANDGEIDTGSYWGTDTKKDPAAWWQVDLGKQTTVGRAVVIGYYGDNRSYGFTIEGSLDGKDWKLLADRRDNKEPSTEAGYTYTFEQRPVRFLRVTVTGNSANTGRHLVEVLAFEK